MHTFVEDFEKSQFLDGVYSIQNAQLGQTRTGKPFLKALIGDKTGQVPGRMWNMSEQIFATLPTNGFVWLAGQTQPYQGEIQLIIQEIRPVEVSEEELRNLLPATSRDVEAMFDELTALLDTVQHPAMRALVQAYLDDVSLMEQFRTAPAAVMLHHAYLGGLLEHTLQLCKLADVTLPLYPHLNRDIVLVGLFLHDMSKCHELEYGSAFSYSEEGLLLGHLVMGAQLIADKAAEAEAVSGESLPGGTLMVLQHIIISHHGVPEFGAAKLPSTPEAVFISQLDNLDAKTQMTLDAARRDRPISSTDDANGNFTEKVWALQTRVYRPDPLDSDGDSA